MTTIIDIKSKRHISATYAAGLAISAFLALGAFALSASAAERRDDHHGGDYRHQGGYAAGGNGYVYQGADPYYAPPVVYGSPYYYPPPVVYGPGIGINLPGVSIGIN